MKRTEECFGKFKSDRYRLAALAINWVGRSVCCYVIAACLQSHDLALARTLLWLV